jgi:hypothetical protein
MESEIEASIPVSHGGGDDSARTEYGFGPLQLGTITRTYHRGHEYRSICAPSVGRERVVSGEAQLELEVHGLRAATGTLRRNRKLC